MSRFGTCPLCGEELRSSDPVEVRHVPAGAQIKAVCACGVSAWFARTGKRWLLVVLQPNRAIAVRRALDP